MLSIKYQCYRNIVRGVLLSNRSTTIPTLSAVSSNFSLSKTETTITLSSSIQSQSYSTTNIKQHSQHRQQQQQQQNNYQKNKVKSTTVSPLSSSSSSTTTTTTNTNTLQDDINIIKINLKNDPHGSGYKSSMSKILTKHTYNTLAIEAYLALDQEKLALEAFSRIDHSSLTNFYTPFLSILNFYIAKGQHFDSIAFFFEHIANFDAIIRKDVDYALSWLQEIKDNQFVPNFAPIQKLAELMAELNHEQGLEDLAVYVGNVEAKRGLGTRLIVYNEQSSNALLQKFTKMIEKNSANKSLLTNHMIRHYLQIDQYERALYWYAKRVVEYQIAANHHTVYNFIIYHRRNNHINLIEYWERIRTGNGIDRSVETKIVEEDTTRAQSNHVQSAILFATAARWTGWSRRTETLSIAPIYIFSKLLEQYYHWIVTVVQQPSGNRFGQPNAQVYELVANLSLKIDD
ncbi:hypothetical protein PPL_12347 [Heterostelium album PN500]|uniref:Uncharacterized protein n=1 Tax=Heterostelium pallidum (strain ATCC 26659 / Pp 5 / PN500) TaxID=670386 RepID=D3BMD4_HETP5|nr:hypothetical protein PPL_12347 [Heterostelium album PN500]EFA77735.1 hypothetical protein PPL_12347 [Heterostelium album PN500]|eukprot:XP_020429863.1 hypothetical protein PPL_12347 [Heterostelium album PN500]